MTTAQRPPTEEEIREVVEQAGQKHDADSLVDQWLFDVIDGDVLWKRWTCNDEKCPARPEWDKALSDMFERVKPHDLTEEFYRAVTEHFVRELTAFVAEHPEAPRAT